MNDRIQRWKDLQFGMFIHFGIYSMLGGMWQGERITKGYSEQIHNHAQIPKDEYAQLAKQFNPVNFDADAIAQLAVDAGMKYIVITTKHHDGFCLFHSRHTTYNMVDATPYGKDIVAELAEACRKHDLKFGVYFSWIDWHYPHAIPMSPTSNNSDPIPEKHMDFNLAQVEELLIQYGPIAEVWFDMGAPTLAQSKAMADLVHRLQPDALVNGRIWHGLSDFTVLGDNQIPDFKIDGPWQTPASIYHATWGYRSWQERTNLSGKITEQVSNLKSVWALGGNYLLNIGPQGDGSVVEFEADVLRGIGQALRENPSLSNKVGEDPSVRHRIVLNDKDAELFYRFDGANYASVKPMVAQKRWVVDVPSTGKCEIEVDMNVDCEASNDS